MGMKSNSGHFIGTNGHKRGLLPLNIQLFARLPENDSQIKHMFRIDDGHLPNTPNNRKQIIAMTEDKSNYLGLDIHGNECYSKKTSEGQLWATVRKGIIQNCGLNNEEIPYVEGIGLKKNKIKKVKR